jgi:hypothetical protein
MEAHDGADGGHELAERARRTGLGRQRPTSHRIY